MHTYRKARPTTAWWSLASMYYESQHAREGVDPCSKFGGRTSLLPAALVCCAWPGRDVRERNSRRCR
jgi:hypothetical protein